MKIENKIFLKIKILWPKHEVWNPKCVKNKTILKGEIQACKY